jgi:predicted cytidylate kinase
MIITISGKPGAGKSTVARLLAKKLKMEYIEMGKIAQEIALRRKLTIGTLMQHARTDPSIDKEIDSYQKNLAKNKSSFIIDGRISFHFIKNATNIFLDIDEKEAARRIFKKPREPDEPAYNTINEVQDDIHKRMQANQQQYLKYYGIDYLDHKNYHLVINTTKKKPEQVVNEIVEFVS